MNNPKKCSWSFYLADIPICKLETIPCERVRRCPARVAGLLDPIEANFEVVEEHTWTKDDDLTRYIVEAPGLLEDKDDIRRHNTKDD